jgi:transcriptional regulator with XRE-family HTH domain
MNEKQISEMIGILIRKRRYLNQMTQSQVGNQLGCTFQQIQKYENAKNRISLPKLVYIMKALNIKFAELDEVYADVLLPSEQNIQQESEDNVERS